LAPTRSLIGLQHAATPHCPRRPDSCIYHTRLCKLSWGPNVPDPDAWSRGSFSGYHNHRLGFNRVVGRLAWPLGIPPHYPSYVHLARDARIRRSSGRPPHLACKENHSNALLISRHPINTGRQETGQKAHSGWQKPRLYEAVVERQGRHNRLVALGAFLELGHIQAAVLILVHHPEDLAHALLGRVLVFGQLHHGTNLGGSDGIQGGGSRQDPPSCIWPQRWPASPRS